MSAGRIYVRTVHTALGEESVHATARPELSAQNSHTHPVPG
jgi:hypothetical protein